jgi:hypothetical protein
VRPSATTAAAAQTLLPAPAGAAAPAARPAAPSWRQTHPAAPEGSPDQAARLCRAQQPQLSCWAAVMSRRHSTPAVAWTQGVLGCASAHLEGVCEHVAVAALQRAEDVAIEAALQWEGAKILPSCAHECLDCVLRTSGSTGVTRQLMPTCSCAAMLCSSSSMLCIRSDIGLAPRKSMVRLPVTSASCRSGTACSKRWHFGTSSQLTCCA